MKVVRISFKKLYFYPLFIFATLALGVQVGVNLWHNKEITSTRNIITAIVALVGLIGSIIVRKENNDKQT